MRQVLYVAVMYAAAWPFLQDFLGVEEAPVPATMWFLVVVSAISNVLVIGYHYAVPAHPKFLVVGWRKAILRIHILSGSVELLAGLTVLFVPGAPEWAARVMAVAALCFHVPSAYVQTSIVFGARAIMRPAYLLCIGLHALCAVKLWMNPGSTYWASATFLVFNVYVWCRLYYFLFDKLGLFSGAKYSVAIVLAGLTTTPAVLGASSMIVLGLGTALYIALYKLVERPDAAAWNDFVREKARDGTAAAELRALWQSDELDSARAARVFFDRFDPDRDGLLQPTELRALALDAKLPSELVPRLLEESSAGLDFDRFEARLWPLPAIRERAAIVLDLAGARSDRDKAALVFKRLDLDADGWLGRDELVALLLEWSMPKTEADRWLSRASATAQGIDFERFFSELRPVWRFIYYDVIEAQHGTREDMIVRAVTAAKHASAARSVRLAVHRELAARVHFLSQADDRLLDALASSLTEEAHPAGHTLFSEGAAGDTFFIVRSGKVRISIAGERIADLGPGEYFGEGALLTDHPRTATATALEGCSLLGMTRGSFRYLLERHPSLQSAIERIHEDRRLGDLRRQLHRELLARVPFLQFTSAELLDLLARSLERRVVPAGACVVREGDPGDEFYLVAEGTLRIERGGEAVNVIAAGSWFGEGALLSSAPRAASVVAERPSILYAMRRPAFDRILVDFPAVSAALKASHRERTQQPRSA